MSMTTSAERMRALRERRAAEIEPGPGAGAGERGEGELLGPAVEQTLAALGLPDRFAAAAQLARGYAAAIDAAQGQAAALVKLGPLLAKALAELGATPASSKVPARPERARPNKVAQLRAAHARHPAVRKRGF